MSTLTQDQRYNGDCSALMLSARAELLACDTLEEFDWTRVAESDPRIQSDSVWLRRDDREYIEITTSTTSSPTNVHRWISL